MNKVLLLLIISIISICIYGQDIVQNDSLDKKKGTARDFRSYVREGNRQYNSGHASEADRAYRQALQIDESSPIATYNLGDALYRQQRYEEAEKKFNEAVTEMTDKKDKARAYHNLGNSYVQQLNQQSDGEDYKTKLKSGIEAYKEALRNNPNDDDTKYNLSYALKLLKQFEQQQQQNQDNKDNQENKDKQDKQDQQNQDGQQEQKQQQQQVEISPEDAQRLLDAIEQEEKKLLEELQQKERGSRRNVEKNW